MSSLVRTAADVAVDTQASDRLALREHKGVYRQHNLAGYAFIAPWLLGLFAFTILPTLASLYFAFTDYDGLSAA